MPVCRSPPPQACWRCSAPGVGAHVGHQPCRRWTRQTGGRLQTAHCCCCCCCCCLAEDHETGPANIQYMLMCGMCVSAGMERQILQTYSICHTCAGACMYACLIVCACVKLCVFACASVHAGMRARMCAYVHACRGGVHAHVRK